MCNSFSSWLSAASQVIFGYGHELCLRRMLRKQTPKSPGAAKPNVAGLRGSVPVLKENVTDFNAI